jgi:NADPH-dependent curcumin reductase CurA
MARAEEIKYREDVIDGLTSAPRAFISRLTGGNLGKLIVPMGTTPAQRHNAS